MTLFSRFGHRARSSIHRRNLGQVIATKSANGDVPLSYETFRQRSHLAVVHFPLGDLARPRELGLFLWRCKGIEVSFERSLPFP